jgi:predicted NBD/HSP70 family sugar kinase
MNSALVLRTIREGGPLSRAQLARATGPSKPTVNEVVDALLRAGYVSENAADGRAEPRRPGPRGRLLSFRADLGHVLGVDIGGNKILVLAADLAGRIVASERRRTGGARSAESVLRRVRGAADAALAEAALDRRDLRAITVGTPGVVDAEGRVTLAPQLGGWEQIRLAERLGREFPCPVLVENETHLSLLAERWRGAAQGVDDAVFVQIGIGIGAGILIGGKLYRGAAGAAGEIGYLPLDDSDGEARDGMGPFEHAAGGTAFARLGRKAAERPGGALLLELADGDPDLVDAQIVFEAAGRGDQAAAEIVETVTLRLARGVASAAVVLNPTSVIIGGGVSRAGAALIEPLERHLQELVPLPPRVVLSSLGDEAVALGAVRRAVQSVDERLFDFGAPLVQELV